MEVWHSGTIEVVPYAEYRQNTVTSSVVEPIDAPRVFAKELALATWFGPF